MFYRLAATYTFGEHHSLTATYQGFNANSDVNVTNTNSYFGLSVGKEKAWLHNARVDYVTPFGIRMGVEAAFYRAPERSVKLRYVNPFWVDQDNGAFIPMLRPTNFLTVDSLRTNTWRAYIAGEHALNGGWTINYGAWFKKVKHNSNYYVLRQLGGLSSYDVYPKEHFTTAYVGVGKQFGEKWATELSVSADYFYNMNITQWRILPTFNISYTPSEGRVWSMSVSGNRAYPGYLDMNSKNRYDNAGWLYTLGNMWLEPSLQYQAQLSYVAKSGLQFRTWYNRVADEIMLQNVGYPILAADVLGNINIDRHQQVGLQAIVPHQFGSWLYTCLTMGGAWTQDKREPVWWDGAMNSHIIHGEAQFTGIATLFTKPNIALSVDAYAKTKTRQGLWELPARAQLDMGLRWLFFKDMATLRLFCNDVLAGGTPTSRILLRDEPFNVRPVPFRQVGMSLSVRL